MAPKRRTPLDRCWKFIKPDENSHCWVWQGDLSDAGYGQIWDIRKTLYAHRVIWEYVFGPVPEGKELHHRCEIKRCVNPFHLECLTNLGHSVETSNSCCSINRRKTHCNKGHPLSGDNLHIEPSGGRRCIICRRDKIRRWQQKHGKQLYAKHRGKELKNKRDRYWSDPVYRQKRIDRAMEDYRRKHAVI